ncbi:hypothetical protein LCGC14_0429040 [marine sediment metagenome]|uniref:Resolvase HTH domain-containing protein n=1 Tax=marine sediment metagenome TaxID=412755 RepID=A0A0F9VAP2_9ZZZZ
MAKLSEMQEAHVLRLAEEGVSQRMISEVVGVARNAVYRVLRDARGEKPKDYKCEGCGRRIRVPECIVCRDRKALGIED